MPNLETFSETIHHGAIVRLVKDFGHDRCWDVVELYYQSRGEIGEWSNNNHYALTYGKTRSRLIELFGRPF